MTGYIQVINGQNIKLAFSTYRVSAHNLRFSNSTVLQS